MDTTWNTNTTTDKKANQKDIKGQLSFDDKVIQKIVGYSIEKIDGLLGVDAGFIANVKNKLVNSDDPTEGVSVEVGKEQVAVDLDIITEYGKDARDIYADVKKIVSEQVAKMTGLDLVEMNVKVVDIQSSDEYDKNQTSLQDRAADAGQTIKEKTSQGYEAAKDKVTDDDNERVK
ncbi:Gls24 family general stress protein [Weissella oryzae SG25]|uniref:Stress response regulator gls24 homolog n=1 Tax=Weissella oryzae (strain DSM 25784 / JCM 18191 / LMG 30913 / SG25) TaxID=1329250 RepID=A0A069CUW4_WEIOS|nr:Asp23/Gls24 family envelope stress response protein [Weissella oryzae]GAK31187.1 Gls24 family general stress protein [Weissella oryzae SG25]